MDSFHQGDFFLQASIIFSLSPCAGPLRVCHHCPRAASWWTSSWETDQSQQHSRWKSCPKGGCHTTGCKRHPRWGRCFSSLPQATDLGQPDLFVGWWNFAVISLLGVFCVTLYHGMDDFKYTPQWFVSGVYVFIALAAAKFQEFFLSFSTRLILPSVFTALSSGHLLGTFLGSLSLLKSSFVMTELWKV